MFVELLLAQLLYFDLSVALFFIQKSCMSLIILDERLCSVFDPGMGINKDFTTVEPALRLYRDTFL